MVSTPLPTRSTHATLRGPKTEKQSSPRGARLTCPSAASGAVATKNTGCTASQPARASSMPSYSFPTKASVDEAADPTSAQVVATDGVEPLCTQALDG